VSNIDRRNKCIPFFQFFRIAVIAVIIDYNVCATLSEYFGNIKTNSLNTAVYNSSFTFKINIYNTSPFVLLNV